MKPASATIRYQAKEFLAWSDSRDLWFSRFCDLAELLQCFLLQHVLVNEDRVRSVAQSLDDVLRRCDKISYEEPGAVEAYAVLHFLDRYHRFQLTYRELIARGLFSIRAPVTDLLDVGTGPGPALFAASDVYSSIKRYAHESGTEQLPEFAWKLDYVERSQAFRDWLHHFTEYVNGSRPEWPWNVPYHQGTFKEFAGVQFAQRISNWDHDGDDYLNFRPKLRKHRFDVTVFSNFLTTPEQVTSFQGALQDVARFLRNRGILLVVGARGTSQKYAATYDALDKAILSGRYGNWKLEARCDRVIESSVLSFSYADRFGWRIKQLLSAVLTRIEWFGRLSDVPGQTRARLTATVAPSYSRELAWELRVYRKQSRPRHRHINKPADNSPNKAG